jgi:hypothetical protein
MRDFLAALFDVFLAALPLGLLMLLVGLGGIAVSRVRHWRESRRRVGRQAPAEGAVVDRPYGVGIARGGDR